MLAERWQPADKRTLRVAAELSDGWLSFWVDDILFHALSATDDVAGCEIKVSATKGATLGEQTVAPVTPAPGYWRVPLGRVASEDGLSGAGRSPSGQNGGVAETATPPFLPAEKSVAVGRSWTREVSTRERGEPNKGPFGGRWAGALSATPCRLQFRVPNRRYEAMYLLATCSSNNFLTVQFYRPGSGFPVDFPAEKIATDGALQVIRVPLRQDSRRTWQNANRSVSSASCIPLRDSFFAAMDMKPLYNNRRGPRSFFAFLCVLCG